VSNDIKRELVSPKLRRLAGSFAVLTFVEILLAVIGGVVGAAVYLPGPIDGWFYFSIFAFSAIFACLGSPLAIVAGVRDFRKHKAK
jgi:O-antigen/teichoic acid export membrane protein